MPRQNRVTPQGEIVAEPWRGSLTGNRGCLHDADGRIGRARWRSRAWIACLTAFRGRRREPMPPGRWTALFFWDEATALAAGHRPCGACRRADHLRFRAAWATAGLPGRRAAEIDAVLDAARTGPRTGPRAEAEAALLPEGALVLDPADGATALLLADGGAFGWQPGTGGYAPRRPAPTGRVVLLTPAPVVAAIAAGYRPAMRLPGASGGGA